MTSLLSGCTLLVTGAARGLGRAIAEVAAAEGASAIALVDVDAGALDGLAADLAIRGCSVVPIVGSVAEPGFATEAIRLVNEHFGRLDAAVNNAGILGAEATIESTSDELYDRVMNTNAGGVFRFMREELRLMYSQGTGRAAIVNIASASPFGVSPGHAPYVASKMAVIGMSKTASKEAGRRGVRVNVICPGRVATEMLDGHADESRFNDSASLVAPIPLGRFGHPNELANCVVFLCSDRASFVNGATLMVDGGRTG